MTKCAAICKNIADGHEQENVEEEAITSGSDARTVRKLTGEIPDVQGIRDITDRRKEGGRNSTEYKGANLPMPVNREMWSDRRVK